MFSVVQIRIAGVAVIGITASGKRIYVRRYNEARANSLDD